MTLPLPDLAAEFAACLHTAVPPAASPPENPSANGARTGAGAAPANSGAIREVEFSAKGFHLDVTVGIDGVVSAAEFLDRKGFALDAITGVDWIGEQEMEVVYDFFHPAAPWRVVARTRIPRATPVVSSIAKVFPGANWHEREAHDFFGIVFSGHPQLEPLLLPEDATYHPLKKDFQP
ncbi:MAG: NADH-quinone oxidoreductase subunit C [Verrucomicrobia bacterium]|jgi:NADH-quinone oxidoreductase subunit C|nr:NADH-quinone oxidoreductase subunit C [Verrucomicrobiota bacterium]